MLGKLVRVILALTAIAPLSISLAYVFATNDGDWQGVFIAAMCCLLLGAVAVWIIQKSAETLESIPITIKKAKSADKEVIGFFVTYALPLIFRGGSTPDIWAWVLAGGMLLFVLWSTHAMQVNPVLGLFGYHFYEVETAEGITYLLISKRRISNVLSLTGIVQLSEFGVLEKNIKGGG